MKRIWQRGAIAFKTFSGPSEFAYEIPQYLLLRSLLRCVLLKLFRPGTLGYLRNAFPCPKTSRGNQLSGRFASRAFLVTLKGLDDSQMGHRNHLLFTGSQSKKRGCKSVFGWFPHGMEHFVIFFSQDETKFIKF